jgi:hypothetical protein
MPTPKKSPMNKSPRAGLRYVGPGSFRGAPARDLTTADINRLAYQRAIASSGADGIRPDRAHPDPDLVKAITAELTGSGLYFQEG